MQTRAAAKHEKENVENDIQTQSPNSSQSDINTVDCSAENQKNELLMKKEEIRINEYYHIASTFTATDDGEISVRKDDIVQVINIEGGKWIKIRHSNCAISSIPRDHLDFIRKISSKPSNWGSVESPNFKLEKYRKFGKQYEIKKNGMLIALFGVLLTVGFYYFSPHYILNFFSLQSTVQQADLVSEMDKLENKFQNQSEDLWLTLESCLKSVLSGKHPCILILMNPGKGNIDCLLNDIGSASSRLLTGEDSSITTLEGSKLKYEVFSFEKCKSDLKMSKVMLISGMESIQGKVLEQFHAFCDIYDPAIKQAVIVFTLNYKGIKLSNTDVINDNTLASNILETHWQNSIHHDTIGAITVRLTENVARINPVVC